VLVYNKLNGNNMLFNLNPATSVNIAEDVRSAKTTATVSASTTVSPALAANANRANYSIYNAGPATVFVREGSAVTSALYDVQIPAGFYWKEDFNAARYLGAISVITAAGTASLLVSEGAII
jgi:hypothetical protein